MNLDPPMSQDSLLDTLRDSDQPGLAAREFLEAGQARLDAAFHEAPITLTRPPWWRWAATAAANCTRTPTWT